MIKILIVDDEKPICDLIDLNLSASGYQCRTVQDGLEALKLIEEENFDLILLDIMLPGEDGISLLKQLKASVKTQDIPVIMMTAKGTEYDKVMGLDLGADDYVTKPFGMMELVSRVRALLRRTEPEKRADSCEAGAIHVDLNRHVVMVDGQIVNLTFKEFELLCYLIENKGMVLTRDQLLSKIWGYDFDGETRTVDVHIRTLRQKLGEASRCIETIRGVGYKLEESET